MRMAASLARLRTLRYARMQIIRPLPNDGRYHGRYRYFPSSILAIQAFARDVVAHDRWAAMPDLEAFLSEFDQRRRGAVPLL